MKNITLILLNTLVTFMVIAGTFAIGTIALEKKIENQNITQDRVEGEVIKKEILLSASARGTIRSIIYSSGDKIKKGAKIIQIENSDLVNRIETLEKLKNNQSAQAEYQLAKGEFEKLEVVSNIDGVLDEVFVTEGKTVNPSDPLVRMYDNLNTKIYVELASEDYKRFEESKSLYVKSNRLNQQIKVTFSSVKPAAKIKNNFGKIGVYYNLDQKEDAHQLLHNETVELYIFDQEAGGRSVKTLFSYWQKLFGI